MHNGILAVVVAVGLATHNPGNHDVGVPLRNAVPVEAAPTFGVPEGAALRLVPVVVRHHSGSVYRQKARVQPSLLVNGVKHSLLFAPKMLVPRSGFSCESAAGQGSTDCFLAAFYAAKCGFGDPWACALAAYYGFKCASGGGGGGPCDDCPDGGSSEPSAHDCQASGGFVLGPTAGCNGGNPNAVCCAWSQ
jgi:hypothetical protein